MSNIISIHNVSAKLATMPHNLSASLFILLGFYIFFKILASRQFKGWFGEFMVRRTLRNLDPETYFHFHDLYLPRPDGQGTTQIDHAVVSPFGVFVIETKNMQGWIFGSEKQRQWTQQIYRRKSRFQNPLHQNRLHVRALAPYLWLDENRLYSVVIFTGGATFKTPLPPNVLRRGLLPWILAHRAPLLDPDLVRRTANKLQDLHLATDRRLAARDHLRALNQRRAA